MTRIAYYEAEIRDFLVASADAVIGTLTLHHGFVLEHQQKYAWQVQIKILQDFLSKETIGRIYFEFSIPRIGKRVDILIVIGSVILVIEFKVGSHTFFTNAIDQVYDYALDLKNFHRGSHNAPIVPILISTETPNQVAIEINLASDMVAAPVCIAPSALPRIIEIALQRFSGMSPIDILVWSKSGYLPTPTIVEAALALYRQHDVKEITRSEAGSDNLGRTASEINSIVEFSKTNNRKTICFITGVPGAGKTLAGLNIAASRAEHHFDEHAVFLSGNGPLVDVLREALARDKSQRDEIPRTQAYREVSTFVQHIHYFRDEALNSLNPPTEKVVVFDEAQRAWNREMASKFMQQKRGVASFDMSEPDFLLSVMNRHTSWCVVICLVGGGQEINTGEAGLTGWIDVLHKQYQNWDVHVSNRFFDQNYIWDKQLARDLFHLLSSRANVLHLNEALHLGVSIRSFRAETLSEFIGYIVDNKPGEASKTYRSIFDKYPIVLTRSLAEARVWLQKKARGSERYGLIASSGANRLRPYGIWMKLKVDAPLWFLNDKNDVRSAFYLEEAASEFDIQGLELDWTCVCWDADFRYDQSQWKYFSFRGTKWQRVNSVERQLYLKNAYRVLLTRARQGMVIFVPQGDLSDPTREPQTYDEIYNYLCSCGLPTLS